MLRSLLAVDESRLCRLSHRMRSNPRHMSSSPSPAAAADDDLNAEFCRRKSTVSRRVSAWAKYLKMTYRVTHLVDSNLLLT